MKKNFGKINNKILLIFIIISLLMCCSCGQEKENQEPEKKSVIKTEIYYDDEPDTSVLDESKEPGVQVDFTMTDLGENVSIHTEEQALYLADNVKYVGKYAKGTKSMSASKKITVTWDVQINEESDFTKYVVKVSDKKDFSTAISYNSTKMKADISNLKIGTTYYWRVYAIYVGQTYRSQVMTFTTENIAPRNLSIDGIENVRDLGGWVAEDGGVIRQGLVYRTSRLNENGSKSSKFTGSGKKNMNYLGIKTEIDLRSAANSYVDKSPLGDAVKFVNIPMDLDSDINILTTYPKEIKQVFEIFGDENNYPIIFHCSGGTDRAGLVAFLLEGLCGLGEEDLLRDYLFSNFSAIGSLRSGGAIDSYLEEIKKAEGETLQEQFYNYLMGIGITEENLDNILRIMRTKPNEQQ